MKRDGCLAVSCLLFAGSVAGANDWPFWRGPEQTGTSREEAVVTSWSPDGENVLWRVPIGGRTTPVLLDGRLYLIAPVGDVESKTLGERVVCLDADTGRTIWEHRFNVFHTDIVEARLGWTAPVGDPETGNVYVHATGGEFVCFDRDGRVLWNRSLTEEFGRYSGYGGRLHTPVVDGNRVIISFTYILSSWGTGKAKAGHRYLAFDKHTGQVLWWAQPGGRPFDTTYSVPVTAVIDGKRMLIAGNADGSVYGMLARTGERVWSFKLGLSGGLNASVVVDGHYVYASHSEENIDNTEMGRVVCIDASKTGDITQSGEVWRADGLTAGYSSPAIANGRLYVVNNAATLYCLDAKSGKEHWNHSLGRVMKGSPVVTSDGVIYVGEVNGRFLILRDRGDRCEQLDVDEFRRSDGTVIEINGSPVMANGRVYFMTTDATYCLGKPDATVSPALIPPRPEEKEPDPSKPGLLQVVPMDVTLAPGEGAEFTARMFDENGRLTAAPDAQWSVEGVRGAFANPGEFIADRAGTYSAGVLRATVEGRVAEARVRVSPELPIKTAFDDMILDQPPPGWIGVDGTTQVIEKDGVVVLKKMAESPSAPYCRMRAFSGPPIPADYTVQADLMAEPRPGDRPVLSDMGLINSRYKLILLGYEKQVRLVTYSPIPRLQVDVPLDWQAKTWYRAKLRVDIEGDKGVVRGKVWPRESDEPTEWTIEMVDPVPNREGSPGLYAYSKGTKLDQHGSEVFFDNYEVVRNDSVPGS